VLLPKEHGAYGQIGFPLATALMVSGLSAASLLLAAAVMAAFLAHEPAAVLLGQRGARARRELGGPASRSLAACLAVLVTAGVAAVSVMDRSIAWSLMVPAIPAAVLVLALTAGREKSWYGETAASAAFAGAAVPVMLAARAPVGDAWIVAVTFALLFITSSLAVRVVILRVRGGGDPAAAAAVQRAALSISLGALLVIATLTAVGRLAAPLLVSAAPGLVTAAGVAMRPPAPVRLREIGWGLIAVSTLTAVLLVATV
jgi:YwiC-like protein